MLLRILALSILTLPRISGRLEPTDTLRTIVERSVVFEEYPDVSFRKGDFISIDGTRGEVIEGEKELEPLGTAVKDNKALMDFMEWVDDIPSETRRLR